MNLKNLYLNRFENKYESRMKIWKILCQSFFQKFCSKDDIILDLGSGFGEFINNIICKEKYAVDINQNIKLYTDKDVNVIVADATELKMIPNDFFDKIFMSNFLEHLSSKEDLLKVINEVYRILKKDGKVMILSPNILYIKQHYWDFLDHIIPLTHNTISELLLLFNFKIEILYPKFLPYSTLSKMPKSSFFIRIYLKFPILWRIFGKQMFIVGKK